MFFPTAKNTTLSGSIYKRNLNQQKLMHLFKKLDQILLFLLTQTSLINRTGRSIKIK